MSKWFEGDVRVNGLRIHYYRTGGNKPPVVMNHGAGDDGLCWTRVAKALEQDFDVIMPDARGHGKSASGNGDYSSQARSGDLLGLVQALKLQHPVVGGHSMGADATLHLAAGCPGLARGIFLEDPPIFMPGETMTDPRSGQPIEATQVGKMMAGYMRIFKLMPGFLGRRMARKASPTYPDDEIIPWVNSKKRLSFDFLTAMPTLKMDLAEPFEVFRRIQEPVLFIIGDREKMSIVSVETAHEAARVNPGVQVVHLPGASHDIRRTRYDGYLPALQTFLNSLPPGG